ncbi:hypothetical protein [Chitinophaga sp. HK235]|uniref:hypothetical protein n=1 Tax=Chitinophaga sp. HK235 TaxID=2952571 RepID=UPI001BA8D237|nr:hypothetical protein [Chitinophaga sp. HK235]
MKLSVTLLTTLMLTGVVACAQETIHGLRNPESVIAYKDGFFVSNIGAGLNPDAKDGDGSIAWVKSGKVQSLRYFEDTLNAPKGLEMIGETLYVADIDHLKGYDVRSRKKVFDLNLEGKASLLNDVTAVNDSLLLVTDSFKGDVLLVNTHKVTSTLLPGNIAMVNGVLYNAATDEAYVCSMGPNFDGTGQLFHKKLSDAADTFKPVENSPVGVFDGIVQVDATHLLLSDWITVKEPQKGNLFLYDLTAKNFRKIPFKHAPADIALDKRHHTLLVPVLLDNDLDIWPLDKLPLFSRH